MRVNDLVRLTVNDVQGKMQFQIREGKTDKKRTIQVGMIQQEIIRYTENESPEAYLFPSQNEPNRLPRHRCTEFWGMRLIF